MTARPSRRHALIASALSAVAGMVPGSLKAEEVAQDVPFTPQTDKPPGYEYLGRVRAGEMDRGFTIRLTVDGHDYSNFAVDADDRGNWAVCLLWEGFPTPPQPDTRKIRGVGMFAKQIIDLPNGERWQPKSDHRVYVVLRGDVRFEKKPKPVNTPAQVVRPMTSAQGGSRGGFATG